MMKVYRSNLSLIRKNINPETWNMNYMHKDGGNIHGMKKVQEWTWKTESTRGRTSYRTLQIPLFVAKITIGESELSKARFKYEKHSISSICTCKFYLPHKQAKSWVQRMMKELEVEK